MEPLHIGATVGSNMCGNPLTDRWCYLKPNSTYNFSNFDSFSSLDNFSSVSVGLAISVISVNGWHELFELHSYRCNIDLI